MDQLENEPEPADNLAIPDHAHPGLASVRYSETMVRDFLVARLGWGQWDHIKRVMASVPYDFQQSWVCSWTRLSTAKMLAQCGFKLSDFESIDKRSSDDIGSLPAYFGDTH